MNIRAISTGSGDASPEELRALAVNEFSSACRLADYVEFYSHTGNADSPRKADGTITAGSTRTISSGYTAKSNTPGFGSVALKTYGDVVETDIAHERRGRDIGSQRARDLANFSRSLGRYFTDAVINHDTAVVATQFTGLKKQCTDLSLKLAYDTVNGGSIPLGNDNTARKGQDKFLEWFHAQMESILDGPQIIICNADFIARLTSIGRAFIHTQTVQDVYGKQHNLTHYRDCPLINAGYKPDDSGLVIPSTETEGTSTDCTSVYLVRFGEEENVTLATNIGLDVRDLGQVGTKYQTMVEFDVDLAVLHSKVLKRLSGIRLPTA